MKDSSEPSSFKARWRVEDVQCCNRLIGTNNGSSSSFIWNENSQRYQQENGRGFLIFGSVEINELDYIGAWKVSDGTNIQFLNSDVAICPDKIKGVWRNFRTFAQVQVSFRCDGKKKKQKSITPFTKKKTVEDAV